MGSLFDFALWVAGLGWLALLFAPVCHRAMWIFARSCAMILAAGWSVVAVWSHQFPLFGSGLFDWLSQPFETHQALVSLQILAFNLFVGSWQVEDSVRQRFAHWLLVPFLVLTAVFGPLGLIAHILARDWVKWTARRSGDDMVPKT